MDIACLDYLLAEAEQLEFGRNGLLILEDVLTEDQINRLTQAVERIDGEERKSRSID